MKKLDSTHLESVFTSINDTAPPILTRVEIQRLTGGAVSAKHLANLDSSGEGCIPERFTVGRRVCYPKEAFIEWLRSRITTH